MHSHVSGMSFIKYAILLRTKRKKEKICIKVMSIIQKNIYAHSIYTIAEMNNTDMEIVAGDKFVSHRAFPPDRYLFYQGYCCSYS
jgi:hypothetical protein